MARHLHEQSGGNPSDHGPVPELANRPASPRSKQDFPDAPEAGERSGPGGDLSDEQLRDFAARLGLRDDADDSAPERDTSEGPSNRRSGSSDRSQDGGRRRLVLVATRTAGRPVGRALIVASRGVGAAGRWLRRAGERIGER